MIFVNSYLTKLVKIRSINTAGQACGLKSDTQRLTALSAANANQSEFIRLIFSAQIPIYEIEGERIMVRGIPNISIPTLAYSMAQGGKMSLPVDSSSLIYSHFEHVSGIPAPKGTQGVTISKLNLLDVLIGQLNQIKKGGTALSVSGVPDSGIEALIENYKNQIRQAKAASAAMPYVSSPDTQSGAVFSVII